MTNRSCSILGLDPGLRHTGWGIIICQGNHNSFVASGCLSPHPNLTMSERLLAIADGIATVVTTYNPDEVAIEETFVNKNAASALKLGQARGAAIVAAAQNALPVFEYAANRVKQSVTGFGHADKIQIKTMIRVLLPTAKVVSSDAADALAVALTHAHHRNESLVLQKALSS